MVPPYRVLCATPRVAVRPAADRALTKGYNGAKNERDEERVDEALPLFRRRFLLLIFFDIAAVMKRTYHAMYLTHGKEGLRRDIMQYNTLPSLDPCVQPRH